MGLPGKKSVRRRKNLGLNKERKRDTRETPGASQVDMKKAGK